MRLSEMRLRSEGKSLVTGPIKTNRKIGRNEICPCGSGIKYKYCCWDKATGSLGSRK